MFCCVEDKNVYDFISKKINNRLARLDREEKFYYNSPFLDFEEYTDGYNYSYHLFFILDTTDNKNDISTGMIGDLIQPNIPFPLLEGDIIIEYYYQFKKIFKVVRTENKLELKNICNVKEWNALLEIYLKAMMHN